MKNIKSLFSHKFLLQKYSCNSVLMMRSFKTSCSSIEKDFSENQQKENKKRIKIETENLTRKLNSLYRFQDLKSEMKKESQEEEKKEEIKKEGVVKKLITGFSNVWRQTFPKEKNYTEIMEQKKQEARILKEKIVYAKDDEEVELLQSKVALWKQTAVLLLQAENEVIKESYLNMYSKVISEKIKSSQAYEQVKKSDTYKEYEQFKEDLDVIKTNIRDNISMSYNPAVIVGKDLMVRLIIYIIG